MKDKFLHAIVCFGATIVICLGTCWLGKASAIISGALFALGLGLGKEYGDSKAKGNHWDCWDILADGVGIGLAVLIVCLVWRT